MKKLALVLFSTALLSIASYAQNNGLVETQGYGQVKVAPDEGVLMINIQSKHKDYGTTINLLGEKEQAIIKKLEGLGYNASEIKTSDFSVNKEYQWLERKRVDMGYIANQRMSIKFPNEKKRIGKILNAFAEGETDAQISFQFQLSESLKAETMEVVLDKAVKDAQNKAALLAKSSGIKLGTIVHIQYGQQSAEPVYRMEKFAAMDLERASGTSDGFLAQDITVSDQVKITFKIAGE